MQWISCRGMKLGLGPCSSDDLDTRSICRFPTANTNAQAPFTIFTAFIHASYLFHPEIPGPNIHHHDDWSRLSALHYGPILFTLAGYQHTRELSETMKTVNRIPCSQRECCYFQGEWLRQGLNYNVGEYIVGKFPRIAKQKSSTFIRYP